MKTIRSLLIASCLFALPAQAANFTVTNLADYKEFVDLPVLGSLRQTLLAANADPTAVHTIEFDPNLTGELTLLYRLPEIQFDATIEHPGPGRVTLKCDNPTDWMIKTDYGLPPAPTKVLTIRNLH